MYLTNVTVLRGDRGLTEVTLYDILEAVNRVHGQGCRLLLLEMLKSKKLTVLKIYAMRKLHKTKFYSKQWTLWITSSWPTFCFRGPREIYYCFCYYSKKKNEIYRPLNRKYKSWSVFWRVRIQTSSTSIGIINIYISGPVNRCRITWQIKSSGSIEIDSKHMVWFKIVFIMHR